MGFFKDFKADLSKAVEELIPDEEIEEKAPKVKAPSSFPDGPIMVNTITDEDAEADFRTKDFEFDDVNFVDKLQDNILPDMEIGDVSRLVAEAANKAAAAEAASGQLGQGFFL